MTAREAARFACCSAFSARREGLRSRLAEHRFDAALLSHQVAFRTSRCKATNARTYGGRVSASVPSVAIERHGSRRARPETPCPRTL
jgi:hypothetical protein